jgi:hypothetical protein
LPRDPQKVNQLSQKVEAAEKRAEEAEEANKIVSDRLVPALKHIL